MPHFVTELRTHAQFLLQNGTLWDKGLMDYGICTTVQLLWLWYDHKKNEEQQNCVYILWDVLKQ